MPTDLERTGDFSQSLTRTGTLRTIYDPTTTVLNVATNTATRQPFAGNLSRKAGWTRPHGASCRTSGVRTIRATTCQDQQLPNLYPWPMRNANFSNKADWNIGEAEGVR
jgi:hypothetical protein